MSDSLQKKCSSEWCSLKKQLVDNLKFCCGYFKFVLPPLPIGLLKILDLSSCQGPVFSVLQGKFGWLAEGVCLPHGISCGSGTYPIFCGVHVHHAATLTHFPCVCRSLVSMINYNVSMVITEIAPCLRMIHIHWDI